MKITPKRLRLWIKLLHMGYETSGAWLIKCHALGCPELADRLVWNRLCSMLAPCCDKHGRADVIGGNR